MNILCLAVVYFITCSVFVQVSVPAKYVKADTIHLRGRVIDAGGNPVSHVLVKLKSKEHALSDITDTSGFFEIKGAQFTDTLYAEAAEHWWVDYYNQGSRFVTIELPPEPRKNFSVGVTAKRVKPKIPASLPVYPDPDGVICSYPTVAVDAAFSHGDSAFIMSLNRHLVYPRQAIANNIEGNVKLKFTVAKNGSLKDFMVMNGLGYGCEEEAIRAIKSAGEWKPGIAAGRPVESQKIVSVSFRLDD